MQQTSPPPRSIRFTGRSFVAFVLTPMQPVADWLVEFDAFAKRSPGFFAGRPVVVDISQLPPTRPELVHVVTELKRRHVVIMGLDGRAPGELGADARGLPPILSGGKDIAALAARGSSKDEAGVAEAAMAAVAAAVNDAEEAPDGDAEAAGEGAGGGAADASQRNNLIITTSVRSGQSIVHLEGDVTVIGQVASGSEIVAAGSIHVYGTLRGRAIAGSRGNRDARIFAQSLDAELVAIDGLYKTADDLEQSFKGRAVQAWLDGETLKVAALTERGF